MIDQHKALAKKILDDLKKLTVDNEKNKIALQKKLEKILKLEDYKDYQELMRNSEILVNASHFVKNNGKESFDSKIISCSKSDYMKVFSKYQDSFTDEQYWKNLSYCYTLQDYMRLPYEVYKGLFNSKREQKKFLMNEEESAFFEKLPQFITIYRGGLKDEKDTGYGISWTLNIAVAQQFVDRNKHLILGELFLHEIVIPKSKVVAYFNDRKEEEIIYLGD